MTTPSSGDARTRRTSHDEGLRPHAYDPATQPELFEGVLSRRMIAFVIDAVIILGFTLIGTFLLLLLGIVTLGLSWLLLGLVFPVAAIGYYGWVYSARDPATVGMRAVDLEMHTWYGAPAYSLLGMFHAVLFYFSVTFLTPFVLLLGVFNSRRRMLHDIVAGTIVINSPERVNMIKRYGRV